MLKFHDNKQFRPTNCSIVIDGSLKLLPYPMEESLEWRTLHRQCSSEGSPPLGCQWPSWRSREESTAAFWGIAPLMSLSSGLSLWRCISEKSSGCLLRLKHCNSNANQGMLLVTSSLAFGPMRTPRQPSDRSRWKMQSDISGEFPKPEPKMKSEVVLAAWKNELS